MNWMRNDAKLLAWEASRSWASWSSSDGFASIELNANQTHWHTVSAKVSTLGPKPSGKRYVTCQRFNGKTQQLWTWPKLHPQPSLNVRVKTEVKGCRGVHPKNIPSFRISFSILLEETKFRLGTLHVLPFTIKTRKCYKSETSLWPGVGFRSK